MFTDIYLGICSMVRILKTAKYNFDLEQLLLTEKHTDSNTPKLIEDA
jgi:hypothetical protein